MKKAFSWFYVSLVPFVSYVFLMTLFLQDSMQYGSMHFALWIYMFLLSFGGFAYTKAFGKNREAPNRKDYLCLTVYSVLSLFVVLFVFYPTLEYSNGLLQVFAIVASVPGLYYACGFAKETPYSEKQSALSYVLCIFLVPFTVYILFNLVSFANMGSLFLIIFISGIYAILYLLMCIVLVLVRKKTITIVAEENPKRYYFITFVLGLFLPVTGLVINANLIGLSNSGGLFGDFSSPAFYLLALLNGGLLLVPSLKDHRLRLLLFFLRSIGYTFILYFFVVFLPVIPIGIIALIILIGIYAFAPLMITFWQGRILWKEFTELKHFFKPGLLILTFIIGLLALPVTGFALIYNDRPNLYRAVQYLDGLALEGEKDIQLSALDRSLTIIDSCYSFTDRHLDFLDTGYPKGNVPLLSSFYKNYVLQNQLLSTDNILRLRKLFFDENYAYQQNVRNTQEAPTGEVKLSKFFVDTAYDENIQAYRSWVHLELQNEGEWMQEYQTRFDLPEGVFVSDYYLHVEDEKKMGLLTDQRAAVFIYNSIVRKRLDPGLLQYVGDKTLELRVFPFQGKELRKTGFELIHKQSFDLTLDRKSLRVKGDDSFETLELPGLVLLSPESIKKLPSLEREPLYHFIIDCSEKTDVEALKKEVEDYTKERGIREANLYFTSYKAVKVGLNELNSYQPKILGGFNLNLAVKMALRDTPTERLPLILTVTDNMPSALFPENTVAELFPESEYYYALNKDFSLTPYAFSDNAESSAVKTAILGQAVSYQGMAVKKNGQSQLILTAMNDGMTNVGQTREGTVNAGASNEELTNVDLISLESSTNQYEKALLLRLEHLRGKLNGLKPSVGYIRKSFRAHILTPSTAFIVVETKEQEQELLSLQEQLLNGEYKEPQAIKNLSEPNILVLLGAVLVLVLLMRKKPRWR